METEVEVENSEGSNATNLPSPYMGLSRRRDTRMTTLNTVRDFMSRTGPQVEHSNPSGLDLVRGMPKGFFFFADKN